MFQEICIYDGQTESMFQFDVETGELLTLYRYAKDIEDDRKLFAGSWASRKQAEAECGQEGVDEWLGTRKSTWKKGLNPLFLHCTDLAYAAREWKRLEELADEEDLAHVSWPQHPHPIF